MQLELTKQTVDLSSGETDLNHLFCINCYPDADVYCIAFCGLDVTDEPWITSSDVVDCVVCLDIGKLPCPKCGN